MRRVVGAALATLMFAVVATPARASGETALEADARASVLVAALDVQPAFDPAFADARASLSTIGSSSLASVVWPSFLVDAFFFLYGFQSVERLGLGIAEARWPQGPEAADATLSNLLFANGGDPDDVPGHAGASRATAGADAAHAAANATGISTPAFDAADASSRSDVAVIPEPGPARGSGARPDAEQVLRRVVAGPVRIDAIRASATATFGAAEGPRASHAIDVGAVTVAGIPVRLDGEGVRARTADAQATVNAVLAAAGMEVKLVPGSRSVKGDAASASTGGVLVVVAQRRTDPTGADRDVRVGALLGNATAAVRATALDDPGAPPVSGPRTIDIPGTTTVVPLDGERIPAPAAREGSRTLVITETSAIPPIGARGAYAAVMILAAALLLIRPLVRVASRP